MQKLFSDEEIQKALETLEEFDTADDIKKSFESEFEKDFSDELEKSESSEGLDEFIKSMHDDLNSKFRSIATVNKHLVEENEALKQSNQEITKSLSEQSERIERLLEMTEQMANSPINKLGAIKKAVQVERFGQGQDNGKETVSITRDRFKVTQMLMKSLDTEEGQKRLGDVVPFIEQGYVNNQNADYLLKSVQNELGGNFNIVI